MKKIPVFAHRGASGYCLENTFSAFEKAKKLKADGIELDVQQTKDGQLIVFHDGDLFRLTGKRLAVNECTYEELLELPIGKNNWMRRFSKARIPTLEQVVDWANHNEMSLNIELKETLLSDPTSLVKMLQTITLPKGSHFSSFHSELLQIVKMQRPDVETAFLVTKNFDWKELSKLSYVDAVHAHKRYYKERYLKEASKAKIGARFYAIEGNESFLKDPHPSVIGWITDYPDKVAKTQKLKDVRL